MGIFDLFSKRESRRKSAGKQEVYQYEEIPDALRVQIIHIWNSAIGYNKDLWKIVFDALTREMGVFNLGTPGHDPSVQCRQFLLKGETQGALDIIEVSFRLVDRVLRDYHPVSRRDRFEVTQEPDDAIEELNFRFREHGVGYQFAGGDLIRVDSQYIHSESVVPAISLLHQEKFRGAEEEFLKAHKHYREGLYKESVVEALKAFESTMKCICDARKWSYQTTAQAKNLIEVLVNNELIPRELTSHFTALRSVLEAGLPTVRNRTSGHGQGSEPVAIPGYLAAYALHLAAANIVFFVEAHQAK